MEHYYRMFPMLAASILAANTARPRRPIAAADRKQRNRRNAMARASRSRNRR